MKIAVHNGIDNQHFFNKQSMQLNEMLAKHNYNFSFVISINYRNVVLLKLIFFTPSRKLCSSKLSKLFQWNQVLFNNLQTTVIEMNCLK